jgi:16S rRNA processing protein RimM
MSDVGPVPGSPPRAAGGASTSPDASGAGGASMSPDASGAVEAGRVGRPHGLDGSFYVVAPEPDLLGLDRRVTVRGDSRVIDRRAGTLAKPIVRLAGCTSREDAEALRGQPLLVERDALPPLEADEYWAHELEGCAVVDGTTRVGEVRRLLGLPSCEVLEVGRAEGDVLLVPLVKDAVRRVDVAGRVVDVDLRFLGEA